MNLERGSYMIISFDIPETLINKINILLERLPYLSEVIRGISYNNDENAVNLIVNESDTSAEQMIELEASYQDLCNCLENIRVIKKRIIKNNLGQNLIIQSNENTTANSNYMDETDILLNEQFDKEFTRIAIKHGAELREYPTVLDKKNMYRNQYHIHFPQNIYGVMSVPHDYKTLNNFRIKAQQKTYDGYFVFKGEILQPCICYHCYEELQGKRLINGIMLTGKGRCFRHEIEWRIDNFRRREFTMREIVFIGKEDWVVQSRNRIMEDVWCLFESLGLKGRIETATDPFFFGQDLLTKGTYQMMSNAKYELIVTTLSGKEVSIASFNYCQDMICSKYEIKDREEVALYSGCVGFGIDRWKEAFIDTHGRDLKNWPNMNSGREMLF